MLASRPTLARAGAVWTVVQPAHTAAHTAGTSYDDPTRARKRLRRRLRRKAAGVPQLLWGVGLEAGKRVHTLVTKHIRALAATRELAHS